MKQMLPHAEQAEEAVLGAVIHDNSVWDIIKDELTVDDFFLPRNRIIFQSFKVLKEKDVEIDEVTLGTHLKEIGKLDDIGGASYIVQLPLGCPVVSNVKFYSDIIKQSAGKRSTMVSVSDFYKQIKDAPFEEMKGVVEDLIPRLQTFSNYGRSKPRFKKFSSLVTNYFEKAATGGLEVQKYGYHEMDFILKGLIPGIMDVVAARPAMGKTAFGLNLVKKFAIDQKTPTAFFSLEMPETQITERLLAILTGINADDISAAMFKRTKKDEEIYEKVKRATELISESPLFIDPTQRQSDIISSIKQMHNLYGIKLVVIDYLQIIVTERRRNDTRDTELSIMCRDFQELAKTLDINITMLCQINREAEKGRDKRPKIWHLRESGAIENEAARIMMLYRDEVYEKNTKQRGTCEVIVCKNRFGKTGTALLKYEDSCTKFDNNPIAGF